MGLFGWLSGWRRPRAWGFAVVDVETTGLSHNQDRIVELALVRSDPAGKVIDEWTTLINPGRPVGPTFVHGIREPEIVGAPRFVDVLGELNGMLAGRVLVAHNARFDRAFLAAEYARAGCTMPDAPYLCTWEASRSYLADLDRRRLIDCARACGIDVNDPHTALGDARAAASLLAYYLDPTVGRPPLAEHLSLVSAAARVRWPRVRRRKVTLKQRPVVVRAAPAPPGTLAALLASVPMSAAVREGAPPDTTAYLETLARFFDDDVLTGEEATALADLARTYSLVREQVDAAHRGFLLALARSALADGRVTGLERGKLHAAAAALGLPGDLVRAVLDEARTDVS